ncbi:MAG TPA: AAA family ATPase [Longimicrobium sp.]|nr:AAA family ATPase [Longimicrobium sp.]
MSHDLRLTSFEVVAYRAIRRLHIPELGRVNLFVGRNNVGKTSLLEALQLYLRRHSQLLPALALTLVREHADFRPALLSLHEGDFDAGELQSAVDAVNGLFFGSFDDEHDRSIRLASRNSSDDLTIERVWSSGGSSDSGGKSRSASVLVDPMAPILVLRTGRSTTEFPLEWVIRRFPLTEVKERAQTLFVPANGVEPYFTRNLWDQIVLAGDHELVESALRSIIPDLERIVVVGEARARTVLCKLAGTTHPVPIMSMGDGANRIFGLAVSLVQSRGGALLIDEVENGLHYSVQPEVWDFLLSAAEDLDVQVFATTHSWDSVVAFQEAANRSPAEGMLYRLEREPGGAIYVERYNEKDLAIAAEQQVEVR